MLALGGDLKSAPALARGRDLHLCAYNGDLESVENRAQFDRQIDEVLRLVTMSRPTSSSTTCTSYYSAAWPVPPGARRVVVQHHFGHALSVMAEHGLDETLALSFDGTGYGTDGSIWGGEFLHATRSGFTLLELRPVPAARRHAATIRRGSRSPSSAPPPPADPPDRPPPKRPSCGR